MGDRKKPVKSRENIMRERESRKQKLAAFANALREVLGLGPLYQMTEGQR